MKAAGRVNRPIINSAPPIPREVVTAEGRVLFDGETIRDGQNVWQSIGGQQVGSIFGHGAYVAPDWTADWLHRECVFTLDAWAKATLLVPPGELVRRYAEVKSVAEKYPASAAPAGALG